jgi:hypothetical protein
MIPPPQEHSHGKGGLVPGFVRATATVVLAFFPPPRLPPGYVPVHRPSQAADEALPAGASSHRPRLLLTDLLLQSCKAAKWSQVSPACIAGLGGAERCLPPPPL